jgi:hypothetical protein
MDVYYPDNELRVPVALAESDKSKLCLTHIKINK